MGKIVPRRVAKVMATKMRLLYKKELSLETRESSSSSLFNSFILENNSHKGAIRVRAINPINKGPRADCPKVWTEARMPLRVISVPKIERLKVKIMRSIFHIFNMPLLC